MVAIRVIDTPPCMPAKPAPGMPCACALRPSQRLVYTEHAVQISARPGAATCLLYPDHRQVSVVLLLSRSLVSLQAGSQRPPLLHDPSPSAMAYSHRVSIQLPWIAQEDAMCG